MKPLQLSLLEIHGEDVLTTEGMDSELVKSEFKNDAEELYGRACKIISTLGSYTLSSCVMSDNQKGVAIRSPNSSVEKFSARGAFAKGGAFPVTTLLKITN